MASTHYQREPMFGLAARRMETTCLTACRQWQKLRGIRRCRPINTSNTSNTSDTSNSDVVSPQPTPPTSIKETVPSGSG